ncbi:MAG: radical SAM protein [Candidatus Wallbacteria bacterium]|nr:radical SAM protein [Candidatus Wallbacteria bacterium]
MPHPIDQLYDQYLSHERTPFPFRENGGFRVCLIYPNSYRVGMSNLGLQTVYRTLNSLPGVTCERAFLPESAEARVLKRHRSPLVSLETRRPLGQFQVLAFSITYEMDYLNVFEILELAGVPIASVDRGPHDPLVIAGGAAITANPLTMNPVFDLMFLGEAEVGGAELFRRVQAGYGDEMCDLARGLPQVYVPSDEVDPPERYPTLPDLESFYAASSILTPNTVFSDTALVELTRGCPRRCSFCIAKDLYGETRNLSVNKLLAYVETIRPFTDRIGLFGAGISDYEGIDGVVRALGDAGMDVTISSLRFDRLTPELLAVLRRGRQKSITVAPESFSQPVQRFLKKGFALHKVEEGLTRILEAGFERVKYYLMYGVPGEQPEDFDGLLEHVRAAVPRLEAAGTELELSFSILEPKPRTELARLAMATRDQTNRVEEYLRANVPRSGRVQVQWPSFQSTYLSDWLCRGDRAAGRRLLEFFRHRRPGQSFRLTYRDYLSEMDRILAGSQQPRAVVRPTAAGAAEVPVLSALH